MKILIKCIRNLLGCIIMSIDLVTRGSKLKRTQEKQAQVNKELENLSLYQHFACPFCTKTRRAMHKLNLPIQMRSVTQGSAFRAELLEGGGKVTVPCLRIEENGKVNWMYESSDIISYLEKRFS
ncbi:glutathione S-transferase N-terminal domain-containing protein [Marinomonas sp. SM2066]|uniref:Glutathione S-transferase N-terminal domain-containing protein n=2 Tax=Marinomonas colpomeniae TaxID=2774408 RepID=A0ABR8NZC3_9GAMM|nr:glutathione S-transferase N-terminal domain-containing protein [Marinomonas colpomeniae]